MWLQFDWGEGPRIGGRRTWLFCAWLSWSRFRVVIPVWDCTLGTLVACLDTTLRQYRRGTDIRADRQREDRHRRAHRRDPGPAPADGRRSAGTTAVRWQSCVPYDPESKGGAEATVRIAKADLVPTEANLLPGYDSFAELADACRQWCDAVNSRRHRATGQIPADRLDIERKRCTSLPVDRSRSRWPRGSGWSVTDRTISFELGALLHPARLPGVRVWCRVVGEELSITAGTPAVPGRDLAPPAVHPGPSADHRRALPRPSRRPVILAPKPRARTGRDRVRGHRPRCGPLAQGSRPRRDRRIRAKMARAVELARPGQRPESTRPLDLAAAAGRFADGDLPSIADHLAQTAAR